MEDKESKTEQPTPRRLEKAREDGGVPTSPDITGVAVLAATVAVLMIIMGKAGHNMMDLFRLIMGNLDDLIRDGGSTYWAEAATNAILFFLVPVILVGAVVAVAAGLSQTKMNFSFKLLSFDLTKIVNLSRFKTLFFSKDALVNIGMQLAKTALIIAFTYQVFSQEMEKLVSIGRKPFVEILEDAASALLRLGLRVFVCLVIFAILDFVYKKHRFMKDMMMSRQEVKDEGKEHEGDQQIKQKMRAVAQQRLQKKMMANVAKADVVLVNPTHYAVAIKYEVGKMNAPSVTAKGKDHLAMRIREIARKNSVPVVHNPPLTRKIYFEVKVGKEVPAKLYQAVAEVLAFVYGLRRRRK